MLVYILNIKDFKIINPAEVIAGWLIMVLLYHLEILYFHTNHRTFFFNIQLGISKTIFFYKIDVKYNSLTLNTILIKYNISM